jgi:tetratricopeptide (TPR) repeat protein
MDWSLLDVLLQCQPGYEQLHLIILLLSVVASLAAVVGASYRLCRWWTGPPRRQRYAARALRIEGQYHAQLNHRLRAMELYEFSIRLNPNAAHVYYLRGNVHQVMGNINRAIADWKRCLHRQPGHLQARHRLAQSGINFHSTLSFPWPTAVATFAGVVLITLVGWLGLWVLRQDPDRRFLDLFPFHVHETVSPTQKIFHDRAP